MSVSKWAYTERCDGGYCPGDCDYCSKADAFYELHEAEDELIDSDWGDMEVDAGEKHKG